MAVIHLTKAEFESTIATDKPVLLDFFANWCGPCKMLSPIIESLANEHPEYVICKIDVDEEEELAQQFGVMSIPTLVVMKNGEIAAQSVGYKTKDQILALLG